MEQPLTMNFTRLTLRHLPALHRWLQQPHVREFWDDGDRTPAQVQAHYFRPDRQVLAFVFTLDGQQTGYVQAYPVREGSDYAAWRAETGETWGIDLFIAEEKWLGCGLAAPLIHAFLQHLQGLRPVLRRVLIDPEVRNERARSVYRKAGFSVLGRVRVEGKEVEVMGLEIRPFRRTTLLPSFR